MRTILIDLPLKCRGYIYEDCATGERCCVLNARLNHETNVKSYEHELRHLENNDFYCCDSADEIEYNRHATN